MTNSTKHYLRVAILALPFFAGACADFDIFDEKKTPVTGERKALFPGGVPGINYNTPPPQPSNSNIPIDTQINNTGSDRPQQDQEAEQAKQKNSRTARTQGPNQSAPRSTAKPAADDDPWADSRTPN
jgi:hypothetical protein